MAAEVSPMVNRDASEMLVTRDLLSKVCNSSKELDQKKKNLIKVSRGWDNSAPFGDFQPTGTIHTQMSQRRDSPDSPLSSTSFNNESHNYYHNNKQNSEPFNPTLKSLLEESCSLELKLKPSANSYYYPSQSVCTLDKVKSALQKLGTSKKRSLSPPVLSLSSTNNAKQENGRGEKMEERGRPTGLMFAAGCPGCLLYVITSKSDPKCPRCNSTVPVDPLVAKKPRIDLNYSSL